MAIKGAKTGDKRKASAPSDKGVKKPFPKQNGPESTRKMWRNDDAPDDSSDDDDDDDDDMSEGEDGGAALPVKKKAKQAKEDDEATQNTGKKVERSVYQDKCFLTLWLYTDLL